MSNLYNQNIGINYKGILNLDTTINTPLDATLRAVTDGMGTTSVLNLSTTQVNVGGGTSLGRLVVRGDGTNPVARFENNAGTRGFFIKSDGLGFEPIGSSGQEQIVAGYSGGFVLSGSVLGINANTAESQSNVTASLSSSYGGGWRMLHNNYAMTSGNLKTFHVSGGIAAAIGSANYRPIQVEYTINNSGAQTGSVTGYFLNATETALNGMTHNLMDLQVGGVSRFRVENTKVVLSALCNKIELSNNVDYIQGSNSSGLTTIFSNQNIQLFSGGTFNYRFLSTGVFQIGGTTSSFPSIKRNGAAIDFRLADDSGYTQLNLGNIFGYSSANNLRYKFGEISGGSGVSTRDGQFAVGFIDTNQNAGVRLLAIGTGTSYIDGYSEGTTKATNYPIIFGSRINNTGTQITGSTTQENGSPCVFGSDSYNASALVQINSTTRGFLPPRMTTAQKNAIATPAAGLVVYDTNLNKLAVFTTVWETITSV